MTDAGSAGLDADEEDDGVRWVVCGPVWVVLGEADQEWARRRSWVPGVDYVAVWRAGCMALGRSVADGVELLAEEGRGRDSEDSQEA